MDKLRPWRYHPYSDPWMESSDDEWNAIALRDIDSYNLDLMIQKYPMTQESVNDFLKYELKMPILKSPSSYHGRVGPACGFRFQVYMNPRFFEDNYCAEEAAMTMMHEITHGYYRAKGSVVSSVMGLIYAADWMKKDFENFDVSIREAQKIILEYYTRENLIEECAKEFYNSNKPYVDGLVEKLLRT